ncbi:MAG: ABC transporter permease [Candidatus Marinimicrobia bacterium]|nr:ABC transporter permease [Candidatus Neomarinimicrobiota bacterium]
MRGMNWVGLYTLTRREVGRFFSVYRQTVLPGLISSGLYILIFGFTLEQRIREIDGVPYTLFILPGLIMMNTLTNASSNASSSMLQMKLLQQLPDILTAPLSSLELSLAYIIGGAVRGMVNGILVLLLGVLLIDMPVQQPMATLGFIFLVSWAFSSMGLLLGQLADTWDQLAMMQNFFLTPLSFLGGIFYSIHMLPDWAQQLSLVNPIYYMINGIRYTVLGVSDSSPLNSFLMALFMTILFTSSAILLMKSGKKIKQ